MRKKDSNLLVIAAITAVCLVVAISSLFSKKEGE